MDLQFDKVHVSVEQEEDPSSMKFLVAYGREATFIAFRGARDFEYLSRDREKPLTSSDLHATVSALSVSFLEPDFKFLAELIRSGKRIIFCGHSLGGAVAQMVTIRFWKENNIDTIKSAKNPDSLIAISFGAPQIWDSLSVDDFNGDPHLKKRFLNVSNDEDPLMNFPDILKDGLQGPQQESPIFGIQVSRKFRGVSGAGVHCFPVKPKPWNKMKFIECYRSAVEDVLKQAKFSGRNASADQPPLPKIVVLSPAPQVISASRKASDSGSIITIRGSNLLFLREKVKLNGLYPWDTLVQTDGNLRIFSPEKTKPEDIDNSVSKVVIKTAFGVTSHDVSEGNADGESNEEPLRLLSRIVQTYNILASPGPLSYEVLSALDGIVQFMKFTTEGKYCQPWELYLEVAAGLVLIPVGGAGILTVGVALLGAMWAAGTLGVVAVSLSPNKFMIEKYSKMLELAIHEASLWKHSASNPASKPLPPTALKPSELALPLATLEFMLQQEVESSASEFDRMMELVNDPKAEDILLQSSSNLKHAKLKSKRNFLRRIAIVHKSVGLYNKEVKNIQFLGMVGEEDAGKSTLIKNLIETVGAAKDSGVPQAGPDYHTDTVTPYKLRDQFYLVDFPGSNGTEKYADAWVEFTSLPSSCILLLDFKGDIKKEQVQTYKQMQKDLDSQIAVVFNKVDQLYTPRVEKVYSAKYFEDHRMISAKKLGCDAKDVHYVCLDPDPEERLTKLRKVGVLGFEELAHKLGEWLGGHSDLDGHRLLLDLKTPETNGSSGMGPHEPTNGCALTDEIS